VEQATCQLSSALEIIRGCATPEVSHHPSSSHKDEGSGQTDPFVRARGILDTSSSLNTNISSTNSPYGHTLPSVLNRLRTLLSHMSDVFDRVDHIEDVLSTLTAIAILIECCDHGFESDEADVVWRGMTMWLNKTPDKFNDLISKYNPIALLVLEHWSASLLRRAEQGSWFLRGSAERIMGLIGEELGRSWGKMTITIT
jgi:hypothetical protein